MLFFSKSDPFTSSIFFLLVHLALITGGLGAFVKLGFSLREAVLAQPRAPAPDALRTSPPGLPIAAWVVLALALVAAVASGIFFAEEVVRLDFQEPLHEILR